MSSITEEGKQWCHPPDACCTNLSQNFKLFKRLSIRACRSHTKMQSIINFMWLCCSESLLCFSWYERLGLCMARSSFSFLVLWTLWASQICYLREEFFFYTIGIGSCKFMVNQPAFVGADKQDVVGSSHGGDQAMALACIPFQIINGEYASLAIPCKGFQIGQTVLRLLAVTAHGDHHHHHHKSVTIDPRNVFIDTQHLSLCAAERKHYKQTANSIPSTWWWLPRDNLRVRASHRCSSSDAAATILVWRLPSRHIVEEEEDLLLLLEKKKLIVGFFYQTCCWLHERITRSSKNNYLDLRINNTNRREKKRRYSWRIPKMKRKISPRIKTDVSLRSDARAFENQKKDRNPRRTC